MAAADPVMARFEFRRAIPVVDPQGAPRAICARAPAMIA